jgi:hypothetical protein
VGLFRGAGRSVDLRVFAGIFWGSRGLCCVKIKIIFEKKGVEQFPVS